MTPEELEKLPKPLERTMNALEVSIMAEIVERIKEVSQITPVTDWLLNRLTAIGISKTQIKRLIGEAIKEAGLRARRRTACGRWKTSPRQPDSMYRWVLARRSLLRSLNTWNAVWIRLCWESPPEQRHIVRPSVRLLTR